MGFYQLQEIYVTNTGHTGLGALKQLRKSYSIKQMKQQMNLLEIT